MSTFSTYALIFWNSVVLKETDNYYLALVLSPNLISNLTIVEDKKDTYYPHLWVIFNIKNSNIIMLYITIKLTKITTLLHPFSVQCKGSALFWTHWNIIVRNVICGICNPKLNLYF